MTRKSLEDIGGHGGAREARKRLADADFIQKCATATEGELLVMLRHNSTKGSPEWKRMAVLRALAKCLKGER